MAKLHCGVLPIKIETGRFVNLALEDTVCEVCKLIEIEDELHFICKCELYYEIRNEFYDSKLSFNPNFPGLSFQDNFTYLMINEQLKTRRFVFQCYQIRRNMLNNNELFYYYFYTSCLHYPLKFN